MGYKIGSFNIRNFGLTALGPSNQRDISQIAKIIKEEDFDVVALQEIQSAGKALWLIGNSLKSPLLYELGPEWDCWPSQSINAKNNTDFAFVWKKERLSLSNGDNPTCVEYTKNGEWVELVRTPVIARFTPKYLPKLELRLINIHLKGNGNNTLDIRKNEFNTLIKQIYTKYEDERFGDNKEAITIALGDYNLNIKLPIDDKRDKEYLDEIVEYDGKLIRTRQSARTTLKAGNQTAKDGEVKIENVKKDKIKQDAADMTGKETDYWKNNFDHYSYDAAIDSKAIIGDARIDVVAKYFGRDEIDYQEKVSNHVPIAITVDII